MTGRHTYTQPGVYQVSVTVTDGSASYTAATTITVDYLEPSSIRAAFDSVCIGDDGVGADCDAKGISFPRAGLKAGGLEAGVEHDVPGTDLHFTMPVVPAGAPDNATGNGQTIAANLGEGATSFSFIGAATERNQDTTATVNFTDGTTASIPMQFSDWTKGGNANATAPYGNIEVVKSAYRLVGGSSSSTASFFFSTVPYVIPEGMTVESITLPDQPGEPGVEGRVHIFAIASDGVQADLGFTTQVGADIAGTAGEAIAATLATVLMNDATMDAAEPDAAEPATPIVRVQWGDGTATEDATLAPAEGDATALSVTGSHTYPAAGTYTVSVTVATADHTEHLTLAATVEAAPVYAPTLTADPADEVLAGADVAVRGEGFAPDESVTVVLQTPTPVSQTVDADGDGRISTTLTVPEGTVPAVYPIVAEGAASQMPATVTISVIPPVVEPVYNPQLHADATSGRPGDLVTVLGEGFAPGEKIEVELQSDPVSVGTATATEQGAFSLTFTLPDVPVGDHTIVAEGVVSAVPASIAFRVLAAQLPGDGSTGVTGPTDGSVAGRLSTTGSDGAVLVPLAAGSLLAILLGAALVVFRRRRRAEA